MVCLCRRWDHGTVGLWTIIELLTVLALEKWVDSIDDIIRKTLRGPVAVLGSVLGSKKEVY